MMPGTEQFGHPSEWAEFEKRHSHFVESFPKLFKMFEEAFGDGWPLSEELAPRMVYGLGLLCWEDFEEILHLCANGYGFGAEKIIRGMFERLVTAAYLHKNPEKAERFVAYEHIRNYKLAAAVQQDTGGEGLPKEIVDGLKAARNAVKETFVRDCPVEGCGRRVPMYTWNELDFVSMAGKAGGGLKGAVWMAYSMPLSETHASLGAVSARATDRGDGYPLFKDRHAKARKKAHEIIVLAHSLVLQMFELQLSQFLELEKRLRPTMDDVAADFFACWGTRPDDPAPSANP